MKLLKVINAKTDRSVLINTDLISTINEINSNSVIITMTNPHDNIEVTVSLDRLNFLIVSLLNGISFEV
jgi:hypothetical protein